MVIVKFYTNRISRLFTIGHDSDRMMMMLLLVALEVFKNSIMRILGEKRIKNIWNQKKGDTNKIIKANMCEIITILPKKHVTCSQVEE
jgi:sorbitol-specific phosphotransferase system component IIC